MGRQPSTSHLRSRTEPSTPRWGVSLLHVRRPIAHVWGHPDTRPSKRLPSKSRHVQRLVLTAHHAPARGRRRSTSSAAASSCRTVGGTVTQVAGGMSRKSRLPLTLRSAAARALVATHHDVEQELAAWAARLGQRPSRRHGLMAGSACRVASRQPRRRVARPRCLRRRRRRRPDGADQRLGPRRFPRAPAVTSSCGARRRGRRLEASSNHRGAGVSVPQARTSQRRL